MAGAPLTRPRAVVVCPKLPHPPVGGSDKRTLRLLEAMDRAGVTPHLISSAGGPDGVAALRHTPEIGAVLKPLSETSGAKELS